VACLGGDVFAATELNAVVWTTNRAMRKVRAPNCVGAGIKTVIDRIDNYGGADVGATGAGPLTKRNVRSRARATPELSSTVRARHQVVKNSNEFFAVNFAVNIAQAFKIFGVVALKLAKLTSCRRRRNR
jgi:hypothetical protein